MSSTARQSWTDTWMAVAVVVGHRSRCDRAKVGAVVVGPNQRIVSTGYNGPPAGFLRRNSGQGGHVSVHIEGPCVNWCERAASGQATRDYHNCPAVHAEVNALIYADRRLYEGGSIYVTSPICFDCAKIVANSGLKNVVWMDDKIAGHRLPEESLAMLMDSGLYVTKYGTK